MLKLYKSEEVFSSIVNVFSDVSDLLKGLSFLDLETIPVGMVVDGAKEWLRLQDEPTIGRRLFLHNATLDSCTYLWQNTLGV